MIRENIIYGRWGNLEMPPQKIIILEVISEFHLIFMNIDERGSDDGKRRPKGKIWKTKEGGWKMKIGGRKYR
jgi:hypothetical protein